MKFSVLLQKPNYGRKGKPSTLRVIIDAVDSPDATNNVIPTLYPGYEVSMFAPVWTPKPKIHRSKECTMVLNGVEIEVPPYGFTDIFKPPVPRPTHWPYAAIYHYSADDQLISVEKP